MTRKNRRKRFLPLFGLRILHFITESWFVVMIILITTLSCSYIALGDSHEQTEEQRLQDPVYRHKQLMEQLINIECAVYGIKHHDAKGILGSDGYGEQYKKACYKIN